MNNDSNRRGRKGMDRISKIGIALIAILILTIPAIALLVSFQRSGDDGIHYVDETGYPTGDMAMDTASRTAWEDYLASAPTIEFSFQGPGIVVNSESPDITYEIPDLNETDVEFRESSSEGWEDEDYSEPPQGAKTDESNDDADAALDAESGSRSEEREVEESDIVKVIGDRMYVLSQYRGLMVVNLADPAEPYIEGSAQVLGYPVSMYVVEFLGFVIVSNAPRMDGTGQYSGMMYIIDLTDNSAPRIVKMVELSGYPVDSRRVGEVIYVVSNEQDYFYYLEPGFRGGIGFAEDTVMVDSAEEVKETDTGENGPKTHVTSIGFYDPGTIGQRDKVVIEGNAGLVYASSFAIYIPQPNYDHTDPRTEFVYIDISDPKGDIKVRDSITLPGLLMDRYQMDHYKGTFRVVTQKWPSNDWWSELPMSTLYVVDARDPDDLKKVSSLLVDDSGNLMATRFAGDRAYTIHLPRTIDPLDVIDLSDPNDPRLTDVLELPGWVEHMEVIGYDIIAIGVDDSDGWKVALSLFDVTDPENAVLSSRITIGEGYTYSSANYDPKALTILEDQEIVLIPFSSYDWEKYDGSFSGVQIVSFDLEEGTLEERGVMISDDEVQRTRWMNDAIVTMSQRMVQAVDVTSLDAPVVLGSVELASNIADAFIVDGKLVTLVEPYWGGSGGKIRVTDPGTPERTIFELGTGGLEYTQMRRDGDQVYMKGIRQGEGADPKAEVIRFDLSVPMSPVQYPKVSVDVPLNQYDHYYEEYDKVTDDGETVRDEGDDAAEGPVVSGEAMVYYDPFSWEILEDGSVAMYMTDYSYNGNIYTQKMIVHLVSWSGQTDPVIVSGDLVIEDYTQLVMGNKDKLLLATTNWWPPSSELITLSPSGYELVMTGRYDVLGRVLGASADPSKVYTEVTFYENDSVHYNLNIYDIRDGITLLQSMDVGSPLSDVRFNGDSIMVISQDWDRWYYGGYGYEGLEDDIYYGEDGDYGTETDVKGEPVPPEGPSSGSTSDDVDERESEPISSEPGFVGTRLFLVQMDDNGLFGTVSRMELDTSTYASLVTDEFAVMNSGMTHTIVTFYEGDGMKNAGTWYGNGWVRGGDLYGTTLVLALGMWGIEVQEL